MRARAAAHCLATVCESNGRQCNVSCRTALYIIIANSPPHGSELQTGCVCAVMLLASRVGTVGTVQDGSGHVA